MKSMQLVFVVVVFSFSGRLFCLKLRSPGNMTECFTWQDPAQLATFYEIWKSVGDHKRGTCWSWHKDDQELSRKTTGSFIDTRRNGCSSNFRDPRGVHIVQEIFTQNWKKVNSKSYKGKWPFFSLCSNLEPDEVK